MQQSIQPAALRPRDAAAYVGVGISTMWNRAKKDPTFPKPRKLGPCTTVWMRQELDAYLDRAAKEVL